jgi:hypothetical protein
MTDLEVLEKYVTRLERLNTVTLFGLTPVAAIYGVWFDDWRPFTTAVILSVTVLVVGMLVVASRDRELLRVAKESEK